MLKFLEILNAGIHIKSIKITYSAMNKELAD